MMTERNPEARVITGVGYKVRAIAKTDDNQVIVRFDAVEWFRQATDAEIRDLHISGYSGCRADAIVYVCHEKARASPFRKMFDYFAKFRPRRSDNTIIGFEANANRNDVCTWLIENRPELAGALFPGKKHPDANYAVPDSMRFAKS